MPRLLSNVGAEWIILKSFLHNFGGASDNTSLAGDVVVPCLKHVFSNFCGQDKYAKELASMMFPLILVIAKVSFFLGFRL